MRVYKNLSQKEILSFINLKEGLLAGKGKKSEQTEFRIAGSACGGGITVWELMDGIRRVSIRSISTTRKSSFPLNQRNILTTSKYISPGNVISESGLLSLLFLEFLILEVYVVVETMDSHRDESLYSKV